MKPLSTFPQQRRQQGLSLIELMIAIGLGVVLLLGLIQVFAGVRASFNAADARARIQENGRFGLEFLRRDARMTGHLGCQNEFYHFPFTTPRQIEPGFNTTSDRGFYNNLLAPGALSIRDDAPYTTQLNRPIEVYDYAGTQPGSATYVISSATPAGDGTPGNWAPALPNAALGAIASRAIPGSDIIVMRFLDENPLVMRDVIDPVAGTITLGADAPTVQQFGLYVLTDCDIATLFQVTAKAATTVTAHSGGLNIVRSGADWFSRSAYGAGTMFLRYQMVVYYVGVGTNGPALMRQTLHPTPANAAQGAQLTDAEEVVEGVEMMQVVLGVDTDTPREDSVDLYRGPTTHFTGATTPAQIDNALRQIASLRVSLLIRGNQAQSNAVRARNTIVVGDLNVTLPTDGRARQTYDTTVAVRNRLRG